MIRRATTADIPYMVNLYKEGLKELGFENIDDKRLLAKVVSSYHLARVKQHYAITFFILDQNIENSVISVA